MPLRGLLRPDAGEGGRGFRRERRIGAGFHLQRDRRLLCHEVVPHIRRNFHHPDAVAQCDRFSDAARVVIQIDSNPAGEEREQLPLPRMAVRGDDRIRLHGVEQPVGRLLRGVVEVVIGPAPGSCGGLSQEFGKQCVVDDLHMRKSIL